MYKYSASSILKLKKKKCPKTLIMGASLLYSRLELSVIKYIQSVTNNRAYAIVNIHTKITRRKQNYEHLAEK